MYLAHKKAPPPRTLRHTEVVASVKIKWWGGDGGGWGESLEGGAMLVFRLRAMLIGRQEMNITSPRRRPECPDNLN